ncbi:hypothetical protein BCR33DRAFT_849076 [Rhizoclosmatium globosum]|uniref:Uncharacterized protein n=1 Tax=Rhizoclosmatium globosum TaxID=329046 RepID=A0A1Y2CGZ0_9FUNG|nr:hypothetical protein BCR33DRAFT_849076 [Rhizoclosmatium globosum]|eukprot:ORY46323.1 hypothetical protein BCR33DRAFT_849076 [Rhizoclosmatium globosum]
MATPTRPPPGGHSSLSLAHVDRTAAAGVPSSNALGATESTPIQTPTRRASTGVLPGHSTDELVPVYRPGRKPGPQHRHSLAFSSEAEPHQHLGKKRVVLTPQSSFNSISFASPPSGDIVEPIRPHRRPHSTSSLKSNIVFGSDDSTIPSTSSPSPSKSRFGHLMNKSSIIFGDDGERAERPVGSKIPIPIRRNFYTRTKVDLC